MSLPFVHTVCRYYRLNGLVRSLNWRYHGFIDVIAAKNMTKLGHLDDIYVGEPAERSLPFVKMKKSHCELYRAHGVTFRF